MQRAVKPKARTGGSIYSYWFMAPAFAIFIVFFIIPMVISLYFSMTVWDFESSRFVGLDNFKTFLSTYSMSIGIAFKALMHPTNGLINRGLALLGISGPDWLGNRNIALYSVIFTDIWKGLSIATVIYIAGITSIDQSYYEAAEIDGATGWQKIRYVTLPLTASSRNTVIILSFIGGLRSFELIWTMTGGGPGFATDVLASIIYKQYAQGYYGLSTAGNVLQRRRSRVTAIGSTLLMIGLMIPASILPTIWVLQALHIYQTLFAMVMIEAALNFPFTIILFADVILITIPMLVLFLIFNKKIIDGMVAGAVKG